MFIPYMDYTKPNPNKFFCPELIAAVPVNALKKFLILPGSTLSSVKNIKGDESAPIEGFPEFCLSNRVVLDRIVRARVDMRKNRDNLNMSEGVGRE